jgi:hypothetical protein
MYISYQVGLGIVELRGLRKIIQYFILLLDLLSVNLFLLRVHINAWDYWLMPNTYQENILTMIHILNSLTPYIGNNERRKILIHNNSILGKGNHYNVLYVHNDPNNIHTNKLHTDHDNVLVGF